MSTGGFSFGAPATQPTTAPAAGGFSFGGASKPIGTATPIAATPATSATTGATGTFASPFGSGSSGTTTGLTLGVVKPTTQPASSASGGLTLSGLLAASTPSTATAAAPTLGASAASGGLGGTSGLLGLQSASKPTLTLGATSALGTTPAATGLGTTSTASTGFSLGGTSAAGSTGFSLGGTTSAATTGFSLGGTSSAATTGFSLGGTTASGTTGFSLGGTSTAGGLGGTSTGLTGGLGLAPAATTSASLGLGGVDPKDTGTGTSASGAAGKPRDSKATKEHQVPAPISQTVEDFKKYVKSQKQEYEKISRMSSKDLFRVQEEVSSLKQLLALVSNGLQRNAVTINNLKMQSAQELKYAEIAQRTKDTPAGLQYENTAPAEYFQNLMVDFEQRMITYRQQIEQTETYINSMNQESALTPQELSALMAKLHSSFVSLAAHLQVVHESVKAQKEHYLNYRKVFHGETTDIFERRKKAEQKTGSSIVNVGPTPFTGMSNAAAMAMAAAINRTPQQQQTPVPAANLTGLATGGFGGSTLMGGGTAATGLFGANKPSTGFGLAATTSAPSLFGSTPATQASAFGSTATGFGTTSNTSFGGFGQQNTGTFQLQKPPLGNKRNKNS